MELCTIREILNRCVFPPVRIEQSKRFSTTMNRVSLPIRGAREARLKSRVSEICVFRFRKLKLVRTAATKGATRRYALLIVAIRFVSYFNVPTS